MTGVGTRVCGIGIGGLRNTAAALAIAAFAATPALAADPSPPEESHQKQQEATDLALEATQKLMRAIELMLESLPQYGPPHIDEQGNIIIPRLPNPVPNATPKPKPKPPREPQEPSPGPDSDEGTPL